MGRKMNRGKQQILLNYLPGRTFDFEKIATIAKIEKIRGRPREDLNAEVLLRKVAEEASAWLNDFRPLLRDDVLRDPSRFVLLDPIGAQAEMYPKVFWCQNRRCGRVFDYTDSDALPRGTCSQCNQGQLVQLRFVKIHRCGSLQPLRPPSCRQCKSTNHMALDSRGSERISNFRWICRQCNTPSSIWGGYCSECNWSSSDSRDRRMDIEVHRAGRAYYAHTAVLLNIPYRQLDGFFSLSDWREITAAKFFGLPEISGKNLADYASPHSTTQAEADPGLSGDDLDNLMDKQTRGEITLEQFAAEMQQLRAQRQQEMQASSPSGIASALVERTGVSKITWEKSGQEMLEAVMPLESGNPRDIFNQTPVSSSLNLARRVGLSRLALVSDFPIITATYGYSRAEYAPNECRLNSFPPDRDYGGKIPIFVDQVQADALILSLNPHRVWEWLKRNGLTPSLPTGSDPDLSLRAYFVQLFNDVPLRETIKSDHREARLVFGLLHTLSHICIRQAALLCGLERTSLSEYILPRALTFALYCNHRAGATIGALTALFEQSMSEWVTAILESRRCVYDPVCYNRECNCHACTHLPETSCRFFNLNLGRSFLFSGPDPYIESISVGYFDPSLPT